MQIGVELRGIVKIDVPLRSILDAGAFRKWSVDDQGILWITPSEAMLDDPTRHILEYLQSHGYSSHTLHLPDEAVPILELGPGGIPRYDPGQSRILSLEEVLASRIISQEEYDQLKNEQVERRKW